MGVVGLKGLGWAKAAGKAVSALKLSGTANAIVTKSLVQAGWGSVIGGVTGSATGQGFWKGAQMGALGGAATGALTGAANAGVFGKAGTKAAGALGAGTDAAAGAAPQALDAGTTRAPGTGAPAGGGVLNTILGSPVVGGLVSGVGTGLMAAGNAQAQERENEIYREGMRRAADAEIRWFRNNGILPPADEQRETPPLQPSILEPDYSV